MSAARRRQWLAVVWPAATLLVLLVLAVEAAVRIGIVSPLILPLPSEVAVAAVQLFSEGLIWGHAASTLWETVAGFVIGSVTAIVLAIAASASSLLRRALYPYVVALQVTPLIAVAPLIIGWLGFGYASKIAIAALICFFPVFVNTSAGLFSHDPNEDELFRSLGARRGKTFLKLRLPRALPTMFAGLKTAMTLALIGAVVGEFISANSGLGLLVTRFSYQLAVPAAFAVVLVLTALGLLLYGAMVGLEYLLVYWAHDSRLTARERRRARSAPALSPSTTPAASKEMS